MVGIEHFRVDQFNKNKKKKRGSLLAKTETKCTEIYRLGHVELQNTGDVSKSICMSLLETEASLSEYPWKYGYQDLLFALKHSLPNHLKKVATYKKNMQTLNLNLPIKIVFLIELHIGNNYVQIKMVKLIFLKL